MVLLSRHGVCGTTDTQFGMGEFVNGVKPLKGKLKNTSLKFVLPYLLVA